MSKEYCCLNCIYFEKEQQECHRYPPIGVIRNVANGSVRPDWLTVGITDWCGEFKLDIKTEAEVDEPSHVETSIEPEPDTEEKQEPVPVKQSVFDEWQTKGKNFLKSFSSEKEEKKEK